mmetsp:Transcript_36761/g.92096  ORF Transcript_36761/g.92096 Transcript_36761/m.92096 type:complete len:202 (+) Transcript_36761:340-945(+)
MGYVSSALNQPFECCGAGPGSIGILPLAAGMAPSSSSFNTWSDGLKASPATMPSFLRSASISKSGGDGGLSFISPANVSKNVAADISATSFFGSPPLDPPAAASSPSLSTLPPTYASHLVIPNCLCIALTAGASSGPLSRALPTSHAMLVGQSTRVTFLGAPVRVPLNEGPQKPKWPSLLPVVRVPIDSKTLLQASMHCTM